MALAPITVDVEGDTSTPPEGVTQKSWDALINSIHLNRCLGTVGAKSQYGDEPKYSAQRVPGTTNYIVEEI